MRSVQAGLKLTPAEFEEAARLCRTWSYWPRRLLANYHGAAFFFAGVLGLLSMLLQPARYFSKNLLLGCLACLVLGAGLLSLTGLRERRALQKKLRAINPESGTAQFEGDSITFFRSGQSTRAPWSQYKRAVLGESVLVLFVQGRKQRFHTFSLAGLEQADRGDLLDLLRANLGMANVKKASARGLRLRPDVQRVD